MDNAFDLEKWFDLAPRYTAMGEYFTEEKPHDVSLINLLSLDSKKLKPFSQQIDVLFEDDENINELKSGYRAYLQFQDILDVQIDNDISPLVNRHYCYQEKRNCIFGFVRLMAK